MRANCPYRPEWPFGATKLDARRFLGSPSHGETGSRWTDRLVGRLTLRREDGVLGAGSGCGLPAVSQWLVLPLDPAELTLYGGSLCPSCPTSWLRTGSLAEHAETAPFMSAHRTPPAWSLKL